MTVVSAAHHSTWPGLVAQVMTPAHRGAVAHSD
jgi:hypothetical protein